MATYREGREESSDDDTFSSPHQISAALKKMSLEDHVSTPVVTGTHVEDRQQPIHAQGVDRELKDLLMSILSNQTTLIRGIRDEVLRSSDRFTSEMVSQSERLRGISMRLNETDRGSAVEGENRNEIGRNLNQPVFVPPPNCLSRPTFRARHFEHPVSFIRKVEEYICFFSIPTRQSVILAANMLEGAAKDWVDTLYPPLEDFHDFKTRFLERFWNREAQFQHKLKLLTGSFDIHRNGRMSDYFMEQVRAAKLCEPPMEDDEIIYSVARHFHPTIKNLIYTAG